MIDGIIELLSVVSLGKAEARIRAPLVCEDFEWIDFDTLIFNIRLCPVFDGNQVLEIAIPEYHFGEARHSIDYSEHAEVIKVEWMSGTGLDCGQKCVFREAVIIITSNLGRGEVKKRRMSLVRKRKNAGRTPTLTVEEAIRRHLRPELINRLTKIVHFKPLGMQEAREIVGKLIAQLNQRLADRGVTVELDESVVELILREGFSGEYGARNLERAMDHLLGTLIADSITSGKISRGDIIRLEAVDGSIRFRSDSWI